MTKHSDFENPEPNSASSNAELKFERADWTSFRTVEGLQQKSGVAADKLRRLVLKELADNALDTGAEVRVGEFKSGDGYFVEDDGPGIDGTSDQIARLFSIGRPLVSTKLLRLPTRGALGNGLRVVSGAVLASDGLLVVTTFGQRITLQPERDGTTTVKSVKTVKTTPGTRIQISFGPAIPEDDDPLQWARRAIIMNSGETYTGKTSPFWYDVPQFHELLSASGDRPVRDLVANLDGCTGARAGDIVTASGLARISCSDVTSEQAALLLNAARDYAKPVNVRRLGAIGPIFNDYAYAKSTGTVYFGTEPQAEIPFVVEAWARPSDGDMELVAFVNRTPVTGNIRARRDKRDVDFFGCGLHHTVAVAPKEKHFSIWLNITTPFMPITSDGKEPNLEPFFTEIAEAVQKVVNKAHRPSSKDRSQKSIVIDNLDHAIAVVSGEEGYRFNMRQLLYVLRPIVMEETGEELKVGNFTGIITDYESEHGEIPKMYREPRGSITHPHRDETITLGTLMVEQYERPVWTFNKILYIEKEGANEALKEVRWPERHDCAVMSSKGFSSRAARDLIDKLAEHDEPVEVFCAHDADGYGSMIYQTLQEATKARDARKIEIINIGLEPWEAVAMGLAIESVDVSLSKKTGEAVFKPVADYVREYVKKHPRGEDWEQWLQSHRIELNAMTTPQFIAWLDAKMTKHGGGKLIPPNEVLDDELAKAIEAKVRADLVEQILREAGLEAQVADAIASIKLPSAVKLKKDIAQMFKREPGTAWRDHVEAVAETFKIRKAD